MPTSSLPLLSLPMLPGALTWVNAPVAAAYQDDRLTIEAGPLTDLFADPQGSAPRIEPPILLFAPDAQFTLSAHVSVEFTSTFDAGVLVVWAGENSWAKLCFEFSPQGQPMVVTVTNNGISDDSNSIALDRRDVWLRITRINPSFAFHYSLDGHTWHMARYFTLVDQNSLLAGFSAQSPTGQGCRATFGEIVYKREIVRNLRSLE